MQGPPDTPDLEIFDPLLQRLELAESATFYPLGFPLEIRSNSAVVIDAARESWELFPQIFDRPPARLRLIVSPTTVPAVLGAPVLRAQQHLLSIVLDAANFALCDLRCGFGFACLSEDAIIDKDYLRWFFVEAMTYSILSTLHLTPLHAGCVARDGRGLLLCGVSAAGKSTLTYACARAGFAYVSDDVSSLVRGEPSCQVIGKPFQFRFRDTAPALFPELGAFMPKTAPNGKPSIEIRTHELAAIRTALTCEAECLVFLNRGGSGAPYLSPVEPDEARRRLQSDLPVLEPRAWSEQRASLARLITKPAFELRYSDLDAAVVLLERLLADVRKQPGT
jgi:hypothetical protein